ncbi:MAG: cell division protein FtsA [Verrucomicrobiota bacterium]|nr:cell division protein FtsA [Verrucomicrobiota bacterium]
MRKNNIRFTGIEIGTYSIKAVQADILPDNSINILGGIEKKTSGSVIKGRIVDTLAIEDKLRSMLAELENSTREEIGDIIFATTGSHIRVADKMGIVSVNSQDGRITEEDLDRAREFAGNNPASPEEHILHFIDKRYSIAEQKQEVQNPIGIVANSLSVDVHIVYGDTNTLKTTATIIEEIMGKPPADIALTSVADAFALLKTEDREGGVLFINMGEGVTDYTIFRGVGCISSGILSIGCQNVVNDLAIGLELSMSKCRKLFEEDGSAIATGEEELVYLDVDNNLHVARSSIEQIMELRLREILEEIKIDLTKNTDISLLCNKVILVGGGAQIKNIRKLARDVFYMPVHVATPRDMELVNNISDEINNPRFVTPVALIRYAGNMSNLQSYEPSSLWEQFKKDLKDAIILIKRSLNL